MAVDVGQIPAAKVEKDNAYISNAHVSKRDSTRTNEAEVNVYEKIGGYESRSVSNASIKITGAGLNLIFAYIGGVTIDFAGTVVELDSDSVEQTVYDDSKASDEFDESAPQSVEEDEELSLPLDELGEEVKI